MLFSGLSLARRLERAEGDACRRFAEAGRRIFPENGAEWIECAGCIAVFNGVGSPVTQTFGLGVLGESTAASLDRIEQFFFERGADVDHEVSPYAGVTALDLLCARGYRPIEISQVLFQSLEKLEAVNGSGIEVRVIGLEEAELWAGISARGWAAEHPEMLESILKFSALACAREYNTCFLAELDGQPGAAGALSTCEGVALFGGAATVPELRGRGLQSALLEARLRFAFEQDCDIAMMVAEPGSKSQRNAERVGFKIAYTRMKWRLRKSEQSPAVEQPHH